MASDRPPLEQVDRILEGEPIEVGSRTVQPVARLRGTRFNADSERGGIAGAVIVLQPEEAIVQENGSEDRVSLAKSKEVSVRNPVVAGAAITALCLVIMGTARLFAKRHAKHRTAKH